MTQALTERDVVVTGATGELPPSPVRGVPRWQHFGDLLDALGDVPVSRILMDPPPGTATEADMVWKVEHDDRLVELVERTLVEKPMGDWEDGFSSQIAYELGAHVYPRKLGWINGSQGMKRMSGGNVRQPDAAFTSIMRMSAKQFRDLRTLKINPVAPDLVVEVLSESNTRAEMDKKRAEYFASGTSLVWEVDPEPQTFAVYTRPETPDAVLTRAGTLTGGTVLPEFRLELESFWSRFDMPV